MTKIFPAVALIALCAQVEGAKADRIVVPVTTSGQYSLIVDGKKWLTSAPTKIVVGGTTLSSSDSSLVLLSNKATSGSGWTGTELAWGPVSKTGGWTTTIKIFGDSHVEFQQSFPAGIGNISAAVDGARDVVSAFPAWKVRFNARVFLFIMLWDHTRFVGNFIFTHKKVMTACPLR